MCIRCKYDYDMNGTVLAANENNNIVLELSYMKNKHVIFDSYNKIIYESCDSTESFRVFLSKCKELSCKYISKSSKLISVLYVSSFSKKLHHYDCVYIKNRNYIMTFVDFDMYKFLTNINAFCKYCCVSGSIYCSLI
jgi:hypothetical protein